MIHTPDIINEVGAPLRPMLTTDEVADLLRCSRRQVYRLIAARRLQVSQDRPRSPILIPKLSVLEYLTEGFGG